MKNATKQIQVPAALRWEIFARYLCEKQGIAADEISIAAGGEHHYSLEPEVRGVAFDGQRFVLRTDRPGLYDCLDERLLHGSAPARSPEDSRAERAKMDLLRRFFLPFEQPVFRWLLAVEEREQGFCGSCLPDGFLRELLRFWQVEGIFEPSRAEILLAWLPQAHRLTGDWEQTARVWSRVLGYDLRLRTVAAAPSNFDVEKMQTAAAAPTSLVVVPAGEGAVLTPFAVQVEVASAADDFEKFQPVGLEFRRVSVLANFFLPAGLDWFLSLKIASHA